jgi:hypothetical protein
VGGKVEIGRRGFGMFEIEVGWFLENRTVDLRASGEVGFEE